MFVYYFAHLDLSFEEVDGRIRRMLGDLSGWADAAYRHGEELRARVGPGGSRPIFAKTVTLDVGRSTDAPGRTTIPLAWQATGAAGLFPRMSADLSLARLGPDMTQLGFSGSYEAPGGTFGQTVDEALLHRIAESSVKSFVDSIAAAVENDARQPVARD